MPLHQFDAVPQILDQLPAVIWEYDHSQERFTWVAGSTAALLGYTHEEWLSPRFWRDRLHVDDCERTIQSCQAAFAAGEDHALNYRMWAADGHVVWLRGTARPLRTSDGKARVTGVMLDITREHEAEMQLRASEQRFRSLVLSIGDVVFRVGRDLRMAEVYQRTQAIPALSDRCVGRRPTELFGDAGRIHEEAMERALQGERVTYEYQAQPSRPNQPAQWLSFALSPLREESEEVVGIVGVARDITSFKLAEQERQYQRMLLEAQLDASPDGVLVVSREGRLVSFNRRFTDLWGLPSRILELRNDRDTLALVLAQVAEPEPFRSSIEQIYRHPEERSFDEVLLKDGRVFERYSAPLLDADHAYHGRIWFFRDVSERKRMEARMAAADRLASIGTLAAGVAHEINNPLAYVSSNLNYLQERFLELVGHAPSVLPSQGPPGGAMSEELGEILEALAETREGIERVRHIVQDLRTFSHMDAEEEALDEVDLAQVIQFAVKLTRREITYRAKLELELSELPPVYGSSARLGQVFLNLLVNAVQSLREGDSSRNRVRITARKVEPGSVVVEISDTGQGIAPELQHRIFEPFFTTKPVGVGTGLGLFICHGIVTAHGGDITYESELGRGTTFRVTLPVAQQGASPSPNPG